MENINVVLADDHVIVRDGIKALLADVDDIKVIGEAANGKEALQVVKDVKPDILIIDIKMPEMNGLEATRLLTHSQSATKALILSMHDLEEYVLQSVQSGASGYLLKDTGKEEFVKAIRKVNAGEKYFSSDISNVIVNSYLNNIGIQTPAPELPDEPEVELTRREKQILGFIVEGASNKEIAEDLSKSVRTIETHRFNIMKKLGVKNVAELIKTTKDRNVLG